MRPVPLALALALSCGVARAAPAPAPHEAPAGPTLRERLAAPVSLSLREQSLRAAVDALGGAAKVPITLDSVAIQQQLGFTPEQPPAPVNLDLKDVPLRTGLRRLLEPYGLSFAVVGDSVVVSTDEALAARQFRQRIDVDFDNVELAAALKRLAADAGVNLALDPRAGKEASAKVSLRLEDVSLDTAVRLLAETAGLKPVRVGNVLFVTDKATAAAMRQEAPAPPVVEKRLLDSSDSFAPSAAPIPPVPPAGVPPAVPPAVRDDPK